MSPDQGVAPEGRRRRTDTSNMDARRAVAGALEQFANWRGDLARFAAQANRALSDRERRAMLDRCSAIEAELLEVRTALLLDLGDAPAQVAGHSRVVDVEKALDGVAAQAEALRARLG